MVILPFVISAISLLIGLVNIVVMWPAIINSVYEFIARIFL